MIEQKPNRLFPISLDWQPICIDKPCIGQIDICPCDSECDTVKQCADHADWLRKNPDVAERNRKIILQHDAAIRKDEREKVLDFIQAECNNDIMYFSNKETFEDPDRSGWLKAVFSIRDRVESLRQQEQPK